MGERKEAREVDGAGSVVWEVVRREKKDHTWFKNVVG